MDMDYADKYSELFKSFHIIPSYYNNKLFTDEIETLMQFTINCKLNLNNRVVFSFYDRRIDKSGKDREAFVVLYEAMHRKTPKKDYRGLSQTRENYPEFGFDFEDDLSPETIFRMMYSILSEKDEENLFSCYILKIQDEIESMANHFSKMADEAYRYRSIVDEIYDESL